MKAGKPAKSTRRAVVAGLASLGVTACSRGNNRVVTNDERDEIDMPQSATQPPLKPILQMRSTRERHWVGDGFHVSTIFAPNLVDPQILSPFILLDHAAPETFEPAAKPRGVGEHPHRGFETVTFAYQGNVDHRDSHGGGGTISAGDVQWMTAASGVVHEEMHSADFTANGGVFEMVQLWVNLPAKLKMSSPRYQAMKGRTFPKLAFGQATGRLIAGSLQGQQGPAATHTPITLFDIDFPTAAEARFELSVNTTTLLLMLRGTATVQGEQAMRAGDLVVFDRSAPGAIQLNGEAGARALILNGKPLDEPVVAHGPFVMNTREEIVQAMRDYQRGLMGTLAPTT